MCFGGGGDNGAADRARAEEQARQSRIRSGMAAIDSSFAPFNDQFFAGKSKAYTDYFMPQLDQQYGDALSALKLQLSASGLGGSSAGAFGLSRLAQEFADRKAEIQGKAAEYGNQARSDIQGIRGSLVSQLNATSDAQAAINAANNQANIQTQRPNSFSPLANAFSNVAGLYANDRDRALYSGGAYQGVLGNVRPQGGSGNSGRVVNS